MGSALGAGSGCGMINVAHMTAARADSQLGEQGCALGAVQRPGAQWVVFCCIRFLAWSRRIVQEALEGPVGFVGSAADVMRGPALRCDG